MNNRNLFLPVVEAGSRVYHVAKRARELSGDSVSRDTNLIHEGPRAPCS